MDVWGAPKLFLIPAAILAVACDDHVDDDDCDDDDYDSKNYDVKKSLSHIPISTFI